MLFKVEYPLDAAPSSLESIINFINNILVSLGYYQQGRFVFYRQNQFPFPEKIPMLIRKKTNNVSISYNL
jgi:hypothetical protein